MSPKGLSKDEVAKYVACGLTAFALRQLALLRSSGMQPFCKLKAMPMMT